MNWKAFCSKKFRKFLAKMSKETGGIWNGRAGFDGNFMRSGSKLRLDIKNLKNPRLLAREAKKLNSFIQIIVDPLLNVTPKQNHAGDSVRVANNFSNLVGRHLFLHFADPLEAGTIDASAGISRKGSRAEKCSE
ncbi:MAG: hypothetical protein K8T89_00785 [Planctomycetes bacterium]|nr:hypothetical protein [Planctomycetota bacterium]